jgi:UDP-glucuronate 4-epimerase
LNIEQCENTMKVGDPSILVTGAAGFIGFHLSRRLLEMGEKVLGLDNLNTYYDVSLKKDRLEILKSYRGFSFYKQDIQDLEALKRVFREHQVEKICNLAAQAGVRYSLKDPFTYQKSNLEGFLNILEVAREFGVSNLVYASSSSVYGNNKTTPFRVEDRVDTPISLYAATKKANELIAHAYSHLYKIPCTGLRYFTVYGPWGRPDMALFLFTDAIFKGEPIMVYNQGRMRRDFTYIDDIVDGTISALHRAVPYEIFNLGNSGPVGLLEFIGLLEEVIGRKAGKIMMPMQPGDVAETAADIDKSRELLGFNPKTPLREGIKRFVAWYREYYDV